MCRPAGNGTGVGTGDGAGVAAAPQAATIGRFRDLGLERMPGTGHLAAVVPGAGSYRTIRRFIDTEARFVWLADPVGSTPAPRGALGFDYDGARFTHVGSRVSFEVLAASFGLAAVLWFAAVHRYHQERLAISG